MVGKERCRMRKINIKCYKCKEDFTTEPYFSNTSLTRYEGPLQCSETEYYRARTIANAICPRCGGTNAEVCETDVFKSDIIDLAIRRHKREE